MNRPILRILLVLMLGAGPLFAQPEDTLVRVSGPSPFAFGCAPSLHPTEINYYNAEVEPSLAVNPRHPRHLIGIWQQDRWEFGSSHGLVTGVSRDGGKTWTHSFAHFSQCAGGNASNGGDYDRATDPWVTFSPSGLAYEISESVNHHLNKDAFLVSRSSDGGDTWSDPTTLTVNTNPVVIIDKATITADPKNLPFVYAVWNRTVYTDPSQTTVMGGPAVFVRTTDGGTTWSRPRNIYNPGPGATTIDNQLVVLPDGTLVNFSMVFSGNPTIGVIVRSADKGVTWSHPIVINTLQDIGVVDVKTGEAVREGLANIGVDPLRGTLFLVWPDARFSGGLRDGIAFSKSTDGGLTWSAPVQVNQAPNVQAFAPAVAVAPNGTIAVTYYDFRKDTPDLNTLLTNYWRVTSRDGGVTWHEIPLGGPFDLRTAPFSGGYMVTDYEGLVARGGSFTSLFIMANSGNISNRTDVFAITTEAEGDTTTNGHVENNTHPLSAAELLLSHQERPHPPKAP